jgi:hypothetical protein
VPLPGTGGVIPAPTCLSLHHLHKIEELKSSPEGEGSSLIQLMLKRRGVLFQGLRVASSMKGYSIEDKD